MGIAFGGLLASFVGAVIWAIAFFAGSTALALVSVFLGGGFAFKDAGKALLDPHFVPLGYQMLYFGAVGGLVLGRRMPPPSS